ncbi:hypothetical protein JCM6882_002129 [Rhodosporidiobolus microsporus]
MDDHPQYATVRTAEPDEQQGEVPTSSVPSIILSPASPLQQAHSPNLQSAPTAARRGQNGAAGGTTGGGANGASRAGGGGEAREGGKGRAAGAPMRDDEKEGETASAPAMSPKVSSNGAPSTSSSSRRPSTAPSPSPSSSAAPPPPPSSESRTFFASLASSLPALPTISSFNLTSLLPSKLPGAPTLHVVGGGAGGEGRASMSSDDEDDGPEYEGFDEEGQAEERERRRRKRERKERERRSMDLRIEEATDGASVVHDSDLRTPTSLSSSSAKPAFSQLSRTPSSAFVAASKEGRVNPLTLQAVARRDSEYEALRLVRERKETDRRRENSAGEETQGGTAPVSGSAGAPPRLLRKQSWTAAGQAVARGLGGGTPRSESPSQLSDDEGGGGGGGRANGGQGSWGSGSSSARRKKDFAGRGLGLVHEAEDDTPGARRRDVAGGSEDTIGGNATPPPSAGSSTTGTFRSASAATPPHPTTPMSVSMGSRAGAGAGAGVRTASTASLKPSIAPSTASSTGTTATKRSRSFFSRFSRSGRSVSQSSASTVVPPSPGVGSGGAFVVSPRVSEFGAQLDSPSVPVPVVERVDTRKSEKGKEKETVKVAKVKTKGKSTKDFGRLFLAQELFIPPAPPSSSSSSSPPAYSFRPPTGSSASNGADPNAHAHGGDTPIAADSASQHSHAPTEDGGGASTGGGGGGAAAAGASGGKKKGAVWAIKFSDDGRYLAVGGKDGVVRVWEVLSNPSDRQTALHPQSPVSAAAAPSAPSGDSPPLGSSTLDSPPLSRSSMSTAPPPTAATPKKGGGDKDKDKDKEKERVPVSVLPVFAHKPVREFRGHEADVLDLSWSKNNFLLSSSMDKTVRLWHVSRPDCLCAFQHLDFVTSIAFHPKDDRFFLSGSLDCKLRLWNIPEKRVHIWTELPELITSVAFTRDGQLAIAGSFVGICMFFEVSTFRYHSSFAAKSSRGKNAKGKKVTAMAPFPLPSSMGDRLLVTTNDSRMRLYHLSDKVVETKYAGHENTSSQIRATFSDDGRYIISGSEDQNVYIWDSCLCEREKGSGAFSLNKKHKDGTGYECFPISAHIVTAALFAPTPTRQLLASALDPIFADGHTHAAPLSLAKTVSSVASASTNGDTDGESGGERLVPAKTREGVEGGVKMAGAEDAIIVVADDETGTISVYRNSTVPSDTSVLGWPVTAGPSAPHAAGAENGHAPAGEMGRSGSIKRWSRGGR